MADIPDGELKHGDAMKPDDRITQCRHQFMQHARLAQHALPSASQIITVMLETRSGTTRTWTGGSRNAAASAVRAVLTRPAATPRRV